MKKYTLLFLLFFTINFISTYSQSGTSKNISISESTKYIYCELVQQDVYRLDGVRTTIFLNFGSKSEYKNQTTESDFIKLQKDGMDALNYMSENGWEVAFKNSREAGSATIETIYLLRRKPLEEK
ncbi:MULTISPECIES: hypothetical protein [Flavobacterium]|uniref:DUF4177 domain-containing protein n=1 Tax=Flavobacterium chungangense TaxID=554283 RepID=A0A6V6ZE69_9FLAO|nr:MULTISPECIES: hypothetical protein [Flavobacterium]CAD0009959.1 hypothetical protein FLACHUCJ7_04599 [Flavobacterium chungangense]